MTCVHLEGRVNFGVKPKHQVVTLFAGLQWLSFMFANTVVIPLSIGAAYHLSPEQISGTMSRSFILTGLACLIQVLLGHGLPLMEGQSGFWWSVMLGLATMGMASGMPLAEVGGSLAVGMIVGGALISVLGMFGLHKILNRLFTPIVMAVLLILLAAQLIDIFMQGMLGITEDGKVQPGIAGLSLVIALLVGVLTITGRGLISNFSILIGLALGWIVFVLLFGNPAHHVVPGWREVSQTFVLGKPSWNIGIVIAAVLTALINTTNTIATLRAAEPLFNVKVKANQYRRSFVWTGIYTVLSGLFSVAAYAPYTSSIGFLRTTRLLNKAPFIVGSALFVILGLVPSLAGFFSTLPMSVGDSVLFIAYLQLFGSALHNIEGTRFNFKTIFRIALPTLTGLAIQTMPSQVFSTLPGFVRAILGNGMLVGIMLAVILENTVRWSRFEEDSQKDSHEGEGAHMQTQAPSQPQSQLE